MHAQMRFLLSATYMGQVGSFVCGYTSGLRNEGGTLGNDQLVA
jgi:hypothetical protein